MILRLLIFSIFFLITKNIPAQLTWILNAETGYYKTSGNAFLNRDDFLARIDGSLKYLYEQSGTNASVLLKARPEIYGFNNNFRSIKLKEAFNFYRIENDFNWGIFTSIYQHYYKGNDLNFSQNIFSLQGDAVFFRSSNVPINLSLGYTYLDTQINGNKNLDLVFLELGTEKYLNNYFRIGYGGYIEKFSVQNKFSTNYSNLSFENNGLRFGPLINLKYVKDFIINAEYKFLLHNSDQTSYPSYEQIIKLLAGKIFFTDFSGFILADFYFKRFSLKENNSDILLYIPVNQENKYYIKLAYEIFATSELFVKYGYSKEILDVSAYQFAGWSFTIGFEISK
jgi:hypothetical protein